MMLRPASGEIEKICRFLEHRVGLVSICPGLAEAEAEMVPLFRLQ